MADSVTLTLDQMAKMTASTKLRERARIAAEIDGFAATEYGIGNVEIGQRLQELAEYYRPQGVAAGAQPAPKKAPLTQEQIAEGAKKLVVPGLESERFPGWDSAVGSDDGLPAAREHSDEHDAVALARRLG